MNQKCFVILGKPDKIKEILEVLRKVFGDDMKVSELITEMEGKND